MEYTKDKLTPYFLDEHGKYVNSKSIYIGSIKIATYFYNGLRTKGADNETYAVTSEIKGIKSDLGKYATEDECIERCKQVANVFIEMLYRRKDNK